MGDYLGFIFFCLVVIVVLSLYKVTSKRISNGKITSKSGKEYEFTTSSYIYIDGTTSQSGMEIKLPITLPQIYLDSSKNKFRGARVTFSNSQRVSLEGDFDKNFRMFAPKNYQILVLSLITPDVMHTLTKLDGKYDIEIDGTILRILTQRRKNLSVTEVEEMKEVAVKVLKEIEEKSASWSLENNQLAKSAKLKFDSNESVKIFGKYISFYMFVQIILNTCAVILAIYGLSHGGPKHIAFGFALFFSPFLTVFLAKINKDLQS